MAAESSAPGPKLTTADALSKQLSSDEKRKQLREAVAQPILDKTETWDGDLAAFLKHLKSDADCSEMEGHEAFNPLMEVIVLGDGTEGGDKPVGEDRARHPKPADKVCFKFVSGVPGKWNFTQTLPHRDFLRWKVRAKCEAGFTFS